MSSSVEVIDTQNTIIRLQSSVIDELFRLLSQYVTAEELDNIPAINKINVAARLRADILKENITGDTCH